METSIQRNWSLNEAVYTEVLVNPADMDKRLTGDTFGKEIPKRPISITLSPNPAKDHLLIEVQDAIALQSLEVYDLKGRMCLSKDLTGQEPLVILSLEDLLPGMYLMHSIGLDGKERDSVKFQVEE